METPNQNKLYDVAEIQLSYKSTVRPSMRPKVTSSDDAYQILKNAWDDSKIEFVEQFKVLLMNRANRVIGICDISTGGVSGTVADPKIIFVTALKANASGIIVAHNHPSGNFSPSQADIDLTSKLKSAGQFLELQLLDHIILTSEKFFSFADDGLI